MSPRTWIAALVTIVLVAVWLSRGERTAPPEGVLRTEDPRANQTAPAIPSTRTTLPSATSSSAVTEAESEALAPSHDAPNRPTIQGRVVDRNGTPIAGVPIGHDPWIDGTLATTRSDRDGRFALPAPQADELPPVRLVVSLPGEYLTDGDTGLVPWHTEEVIVVVRRGGSCEVEALHAMTGEPIARYDVFVASAQARIQGRAITDPYRVESNDGIGTIEGLIDGANFLWVLPVGHGFRLTDPIVVQITPGQPSRVTARVEPTVPVSVTVLDPNGDRLHGARVSLHDPGTDPNSISYPARQPLSLQLGNRTEPFRVPVEATLDLDWGPTNAEGVARLGAFSRTGRIDVWVEALEHPSVVRRGVPLGTTPIELEIEVPAAARLTGTVPQSSARIHGLEVVVRPVGQYDKTTAIREDGTFAISGLTEGPHELLMGYRLGRQLRIVPIVLAQVELVAGETHHVDLDASACLPGSLTGTAFVNGNPWNAGFVRLHPFRDGETALGYLERVRPDRHGAFRFDRIPPGEYRLVGFLDQSDESFEFPERAVVRASERSRITVRATR